MNEWMNDDVCRSCRQQWSAMIINSSRNTWIKRYITPLLTNGHHFEDLFFELEIRKFVYCWNKKKHTIHWSSKIKKKKIQPHRIVRDSRVLFFSFRSMCLCVCVCVNGSAIIWTRQAKREKKNDSQLGSFSMVLITN